MTSVAGSQIARRGAEAAARKKAAGTPSSAFIPYTLSISARHLEVDSDWIASFTVVGFPREVHAGWLQPLLTYPTRLDVAMRVEPIDPVTARRG